MRSTNRLVGDSPYPKITQREATPGAAEMVLAAGVDAVGADAALDVAR